MQESRYLSIICKKSREIFSLCRDRSRCLLFEKTFRDINFFARIMQDVFFFQESCKIFTFCINLARHLLVGSISQDIRFLQESRKIYIVCKNLAGYLLFSKVLHVFFYLQESRKITLFCTNCSRYLLFGRHLPDI